MDPMNQDEIVPSAPNRAARRARKVGAALGATGIASGTAAAVVGLLAAPAGALATWTVNQGGDAGNGDCDDTTCTLRDAIEESNNDGEASAIVFDASVTGEIVLTAGQLLVNESFDLTVTGPGAGVLSVNGGGNDRVFYATTGFNGSTLTISGLTITGGNPDSGIKGGGILMYGDDGGSNLVLDSMVVTGNVAPYYGGGVAFAKDNNMTVTNSRITDNHTLYFDGGGIHFEDGLALTITNSEISGNRAGIEEGGSGGGIFVGVSQQSEPQPDIVIANSTIANNTAGLPGDFGNGGGIAVEQGNLTLLQTTISGNDAAELGDGLYLNTPFGAGVEAADKTVPRPANLPPKDAAADVGALEVGTVTVIGTII